MNTQALSKFSNHLPVPSAVLLRACQVIRSTGSSAFTIAESLKIDPGITSKILRLANSAYVGIPKTVSSLQHAVTLLGVNRVYSLVISSELLTSFNRGSSSTFPTDRFINHSVITAVIAESIARHVKRYVSVDEHDIFSGALLHDIGKLFAGFTDEMTVNDIYNRSLKRSIPYFKAESDDFSHTALGSLIAEKWNFPEILIAAIKGHHEIMVSQNSFLAVAIIHIADTMAHIMGFSVFPDEHIPEINSLALREVNLPVERLSVIAEKIVEDNEIVHSLLDALNG